MEKVLFNDKMIDRENASFSFDDRSMYFGDGVYEVIRVYSGHPYKLEMHLQRLQRSADELDIPYSIKEKQSLKKSVMELIDTNNLNGDGYVYLQLSRGATARDHLYERHIEPFIFAFTKEMETPLNQQEQGIAVYLTEDIRWLRCDIKTVNLLGNVLAKRQAADHDCSEAIQHRGDTVTEGSSSNLFIVKDGQLKTHPADNLILNGITRQVVIDLAEKQGLSVSLTAFTTEEMLEADEAFITSTINEITPIIEWRGTKHGMMKIGPITKQLQSELQADIERTRSGE
ncbi:D-amino-acid transaminase [Salicibibacter cibarius]|uniref:D-alanine aminotransferase n=1 Tax=Salicibibacter cibarius TaxID=2743000 RepID=A0A7T6Z782_9BACI|nr:D-amino-acid transaminase [Salicibibacter cibarius]QQK78270.1 D-amino-acid transaminase [Salicibibacter cibarius]